MPSSRTRQPSLCPKRSRSGQESGRVFGPTRTAPNPATVTRTIRIPKRTVHRSSSFALSKPMTPVEIKSRASVVSPTSRQTNSIESLELRATTWREYHRRSFSNDSANRPVPPLPGSLCLSTPATLRVPPLRHIVLTLAVPEDTVPENAAPG
jgi:hypothetical protein